MVVVEKGNDCWWWGGFLVWKGVVVGREICWVLKVE